MTSVSTPRSPLYRFLHKRALLLLAAATLATGISAGFQASPGLASSNGASASTSAPQHPSRNSVVQPPRSNEHSTTTPAKLSKDHARTQHTGQTGKSQSVHVGVAGTSQGHRHSVTTDTGPPTCYLRGVNNSGAGHIRVSGVDQGSGIQSVTVVNQVNDPVHIPVFVPGTRRVIPIILRKKNRWEPSSVTLKFTNMGGATTSCSFAFLEAATGHRQSVKGISSADHYIFAANFGISSMLLKANAHEFLVKMEWTSKIIDVGNHFQRASNSLSVFGVNGKRDAFLVLWDGRMN